jgi:hypothetical protein
MALAVAGCGDDKKKDESSSENLTKESATTTSTAASGAAGEECKTEDTVNTPAASEVVVTLNEWTVKPSAQPKGGALSFKAENAGKENHELVIVKGETAEALPKDADGGMDEDKLPAGGLIGEIEPFASGKVCSGVFNVPAGKYVLLCNIVETEPKGEKESHFKEGMHTTFVVS